MKKALVIGSGGIGKRHIRGLIKTGKAKISICEPNDAVRNEVYNEYDIENAYSKLEDAPLSEFDMAIVAAPANFHIPIAKTLAEAKTPMLLEKPLAVEDSGIEELIEVVEKNNVIVRMGYITRLRPWMQKLKEELDNGKLGQIHMIHMFSGQDFRKYRPDYNKTYYSKKAMGGGAILDAASHSIDFLIWLLGEISEVSAIYDKKAFEGVECEDFALMNFRFKSGNVASISLNQFQKPNEHQIDIIGEKGNFKMFSGEGKLFFADNDSGKWEEIDVNPFKGMDPMEIHESMFKNQAEEFMAIIDGKESCMSTLAEAWHNLKAALAAKKSYNEKSIIQL